MLNDLKYSFAPVCSYGDLCHTCLVLGSIVTALAGGIGLPMLSTPYLTAAAVSCLNSPLYFIIS